LAEVFAMSEGMTRPKFFGQDPHPHRDQYWALAAIADRMIEDEDELVRSLVPFDERRIFVRFGFKSLRTYCTTALRLSKTQSQRIVTRVRRARYEEP
jgi:hypothetical protein